MIGQWVKDVVCLPRPWHINPKVYVMNVGFNFYNKKKSESTLIVVHASACVCVRACAAIACVLTTVHNSDGVPR